ncbi:MAG: hypothetical protein LQ346_005870 [Caloplaca aetnensis]|nr:MAG: hypothetical protein LQ346_005870 [Caloplaca aetnensis]
MASDSPHSSSPPSLFSTAGSSIGSASSKESSFSTSTLDGSLGSSKRRKTAGSITLNACTSCQKARAKCDGQKPACQRCIHRGAPNACLYEMHSKAAKDQMLGEINRLRIENQHLVQQNSALGEKNDMLESVIRSLKNDRQSHEIIRRLKRGDDHQSIAEWLGRPLVPNLGDISPESERQFNISIHRDGVLVEHLVTLYLTWIHPLHTLFDEEKFMASFRACVDVYCSHSLVNAICAAACHVLRSEWRNDEGAHGGIDHLQSKFMDEVEELQMDIDASKMTVVQSWAIMFLVELGLGHGLMASAHLRHATESLVAKKEHEQASSSAEVSTWGILTLTTTWSALIYQQPNASMPPLPAPVFDEGRAEGLENSTESRRNSSADGDNERVDCSQMTAYEQAKLHHIVHEILLANCGHHGRLSVQSMTSIYDKLLSWKRELPKWLCNASSETDASPRLLFLQ